MNEFPFRLNLPLPLFLRLVPLYVWPGAALFVTLVVLE